MKMQSQEFSMDSIEIFGWCMVVASIVTVIIWGVVACFVLQGMFNLCRDVWRALREKA